MDNTDKDSLKSICDSLAEIGLSEKPMTYDELKLEGWISVEDAAELTQRSLSTARVTLNRAFKSGLWEKTPATSTGDRLMAMFRKK